MAYCFAVGDGAKGVLALDPPLQGYRRVNDAFVPIAPDSDGRLASHELDLGLGVESDRVRFCRLDTGEPLLTPTERAAAEAERAAVEAERADRETQARIALEAEIARLRAELGRRSSQAD